MQNEATQPIQTSRLLLRQFTPEDSSKMYANWASNPKVAQYLTWLPHANEDETKEIIALWCAGYANPNFYQWAIERKEDCELIGAISLQFNDFHKEYAGWMPGYCYGENFWGQGYATEALDAVTNYFFTTTQEDTLFCVHHAENISSGKVMKKIGFKFIDKTTFLGQEGKTVPACYYQIKKEEYNERK